MSQRRSQGQSRTDGSICFKMGKLIYNDEILEGAKRGYCFMVLGILNVLLWGNKNEDIMGSFTLTFILA